MPPPLSLSDLTQSKRRPALVIASLEGDDVLLCQITSKTIKDNYAIFSAVKIEFYTLPPLKIKWQRYRDCDSCCRYYLWFYMTYQPATNHQCKDGNTVPARYSVTSLHLWLVSSQYNDCQTGRNILKDTYHDTGCNQIFKTASQT